MEHQEGKRRAPQRSWLTRSAAALALVVLGATVHLLWPAESGVMHSLVRLLCGVGAVVLWTWGRPFERSRRK